MVKPFRSWDIAPMTLVRVISITGTELHFQVTRTQPHGSSIRQRRRRPCFLARCSVLAKNVSKFTLLLTPGYSHGWSWFLSHFKLICPFLDNKIGLIGCHRFASRNLWRIWLRSSTSSEVRWWILWLAWWVCLKPGIVVLGGQDVWNITSMSLGVYPMCSFFLARKRAKRAWFNRHVVAETPSLRVTCPLVSRAPATNGWACCTDEAHGLFNGNAVNSVFGPVAQIGWFLDCRGADEFYIFEYLSWGC